MSQEIAEIRTKDGDITLTAFWGGDKRGKCLQITMPWNGESQYVQLSITQLILLLPELKAWVSEQIKPKDPRDWTTRT